MPNKINLLDLFSGIGGFHKGLEQAGFEIGWNGFSDIDKYANAVYQYQNKDAISLGSVTNIRGKDLPKIDAITFGSPCQDFSIAGSRSGLEGDRSSLISEAIRLINECRPRFFIWENVKGTFSSNNGEDFWAIIQAFTNIGNYRLEWQLLNTRWFLPQNRERIYLVGCLGKGSGQKIFPIGENGKGNNEVKFSRKKTNQQETSMQDTKDRRRHPLFQGRSTMIADYRNDEGIRVRKDGNSPTLSQTMGTGGQNIPITIHTKNKLNKNQSNKFKKLKVDNKFSGTITEAIGRGGSSYEYLSMLKKNQELTGLIRRLTPIECCRLQGFPDDWNEKGIIDGEIVKISDTQRYKQCGNAVTVNVVQAVAEKIYAEETKPKNISKES